MLTAAIRPDDWNIALLVHVLGSMVLVGALVLALTALPGRSPAMTRLGFRSLLWVALPSWIVMRLSAQWIYDKEGYSGDDDPAWIGIGFMTAEPTLILLLVATVFAGLGARRTESAGAGVATRDRVATGLLAVVLAAYVVAIWAMTTKPD